MAAILFVSSPAMISTWIAPIAAFNSISASADILIHHYPAPGRTGLHFPTILPVDAELFHSGADKLLKKLLSIASLYVV